MNIKTYNYYTDIVTTKRLAMMEVNRGIHDQNHIIEEPYEAKASRTGLKTSRLGD